MFLLVLYQLLPSLVVGLKTVAPVSSVGPWFLVPGGMEQKYCVCSNLSGSYLKGLHKVLVSVLPTWNSLRVEKWWALHENQRQTKNPRLPEAKDYG